VDGQAAFAGAGLFTVQAAAGRAGYVIVGYQKAQGSNAAAWWSASPMGAWQRAGAATQDAQMLAVTATPGGFVAAGSHGNQASIWLSRDGRAWSQQNLPTPAGYAAAVLQHVAANGRTVVAVGAALTTTGRQVPFAAASSDGGATWSRSALPVPQGQGVQATATALAASGHGFTVTGTFGTTLGHQDVVVWTSAGGSGWKAATPSGQGLTGEGIQAITGLAVAGSTAIGVGFTAAPGGEQPVFWQFPLR
jgi:hypothetical protein